MSDETKKLTYEEIKAQCLKEGRLYEDPDFPGFGEKSFGGERNCNHVWKRPQDIVQAPDVPEFFVDGANRFDIIQGDTGDCWLMAAMATVCEREELLEKIIPPGQDFKPGSYAGIFRFNFWYFGKWTEVIIDDRLPACPRELNPNRLATMRSSVRNEFWSALLEKAYAKLNGGYYELNSGFQRFAFEDLSGGLGDYVNIQGSKSESYWKVLLEAYEEGTLMSSSILKTPETGEHNIMTGHAYSITNVKEVPLITDGHSTIRLIRLRNPYGCGEWKGSWDDKSTEWKSVSDAVKEELGLVDKEDGEFWMSFEDFFRNCNVIDFCHYRMDESTNTMRKKYWNLDQHFSSWTKDVSDGSSGKVNEEAFCSNPQFQFDVKETAADDDNVIVALMHKPPKKRKTSMYSIALSVYKVDESQRMKRLDAKFFASQKPLFKDRTSARELVQHLKLAKGLYCAVPYTANYIDETDFLLRIYTVKPTKAVI